MNNYICKFCERECKNSNSLHTHERLCKSNPDRVISEKWYNAMNSRKGNGQNQYTKAERLGLPKPNLSDETRNKLKYAFGGKHHSDESKKKISDYQKIRCKYRDSWQVKGRTELSFAEKYFLEIFNSFDEIPKNNFKLDRFWLDFAWPEKQLYIEIDGEQHYSQDGIKRDFERGEYLSARGWKLIARIRWSTYLRLSSLERKVLIEDIRNCLSNNDIIDFENRYLSIEEVKKLKKEEKEKAKNELILKIRSSTINFSKFGWNVKLANELDFPARKLNNFIRKNMKDFYDTCYHK